jgi:hypothetical protein
MPHPKFVGSAPNDLAKVFAKDPCDCLAHHWASRLSEFAPLYAATVACQLGSDPQSVLETRAIVAEDELAETFRNCKEGGLYVTGRTVVRRRNALQKGDGNF